VTNSRVDRQVGDIHVSQPTVDSDPRPTTIGGLVHPAAPCPGVNLLRISGVRGNRGDRCEDQTAVNRCPGTAAIGGLEHAAICPCIDGLGAMPAATPSEDSWVDR
jgi:hypothetical protein